MSEPLTPQQYNHRIYVYFRLVGYNVSRAFTRFLRVMNFYTGDLLKIYDTVKDPMFYESFSILFGNFGPFGTFQKFRAFFENASMNGLLNCDVEEFPDRIVNLSSETLSSERIVNIISEIKFTRCITLHEVFFNLLPIEGGPVDGAFLYQSPSLKLFAGGPHNKGLRIIIEDEFKTSGVEIQKTPQMTLVFPKDWMKDSFSQFIARLVEKLGFSEIECVAESSKEDIPTLQNQSFLRLTNFFTRNAEISLNSLNSRKFYENVCGVSEDAFMGSIKDQFNLFLRYLFTINKGVATPHRYFNAHVEHFVIAFMNVIGASLEGIQVQAVMKSGPEWIHGDQRKHMVCSSVATGKDCVKKNCKFLHAKTSNYGIMSNSEGNFVIICLEQEFEKKPTKQSVFNENLLKSGRGYAKPEPHAVACGGSFKSEPHAVAGEGSAKPEPRAVAGGGSFKSESHAVAGGGSFKPEPRAVACGGSAKPEPRAVACGSFSKPEPRTFAGGGSAKPEPRAVAGGGSAEKIRYEQAMLDLMMEELDEFDNQPQSLADENGSETDRIMRQFRTLTDPTDMAQLTALVVMRNRRP